MKRENEVVPSSEICEVYMHIIVSSFSYLGYRRLHDIRCGESNFGRLDFLSGISFLGELLAPAVLRFLESSSIEQTTPANSSAGGGSQNPELLLVWTSMATLTLLKFYFSIFFQHYSRIVIIVIELSFLSFQTFKPIQLNK